jgi:hypothetical protein
VTSDCDFTVAGSYSEGIFESGLRAIHPQPVKLRRESFFEIAAVGMLAIRFGWPRERLTFQPEGWALDFLAYADSARTDVAIAGEAKRLQRDAVALSKSLEVCGRRGIHEERDCTEPKNYHRKYLGLLKFRPRLLWIVGPGAFEADPDLVFCVEASAGSVVNLRRTDATELTPG